MMKEAVVTVFGADEGKGVAREISAAYRQSFGAPPNCEGPEQFAHQQDAYSSLLKRNGFRLAVARVEGDVVGFAYGALLMPGSHWWDGMLEPLPDGFTDETGRRTFALIDMGVRPDFRRIGLGRSLHDAVLAGCGAERATLAVEPRLTDNQRRYRRWGWNHVGRLIGAVGTSRTPMTSTSSSCRSQGRSNEIAHPGVQQRPSAPRERAPCGLRRWP